MPAFAVGDRVDVPCLFVPDFEDQNTALYRTKISSINAKSATVELPRNAQFRQIRGVLSEDSREDGRVT